ncbi:MAG TPA: D-glycerate dehydrogenase [Desulfomonilaceae bacterium]|nr:D-glycerate dehydrogenase [Desulfomonilaceae bacterium]
MKALVTGNLPEKILAMLRAEHEIVVNKYDRPMPREELIDNIKDKDGLLSMVTDRIDDELMEKAPNLRIVANCGVGYDNIDVAAATARGIWVTNTPGVLTDATADLTFALILAAARRIIEGEARVRAGKFKSWAPFLFLGAQVTGKILGIIGLGQIGKAVARRASGFNMRILYHDRNRVSESEERELNATYADLKTILSEADFVSLHVTLTDQTRHLISARELDYMKPTAYLINASRGPVVDEKALVEALRTKKIAGAGLDVYENEPALTAGLADLDNVVLLPHVGSATLETRTAMAVLAAENLLDGLQGITPRNCLNCVGR